MKLFNFTLLSFIGILAILNQSNAIPCPQCDVQIASYYGIPVDKDVYVYFKEIYTIICSLEKAEKSSNVSGPPDFSKAEKGLFTLGKTIDQATQIFKIYQGTLDVYNAYQITKYLNLSATDVVDITTMLQLAKPYSDQQGYTSLIVNILTGITSQISVLFQELEYHMPPSSFAKSGYSISVFVCALGKTLEYLQPGSCTVSGMQFCDSLPGLTATQINATQSTTVVNVPQSFTSCNDSVTAMYKYGYSNGDITNITSSTTTSWCTSSSSTVTTSSSSSNSTSTNGGSTVTNTPSSSDNSTSSSPPTTSSSSTTSSTSGSTTSSTSGSTITTPPTPPTTPPTTENNSITGSSSSSSGTPPTPSGGNTENIVNIGTVSPGSTVSVAQNGGTGTVNQVQSSDTGSSSPSSSSSSSTSSSTSTSNSSSKSKNKTKSSKKSSKKSEKKSSKKSSKSSKKKSKSSSSSSTSQSSSGSTSSSYGNVPMMPPPPLPQPPKMTKSSSKNKSNKSHKSSSSKGGSSKPKSVCFTYTPPPTQWVCKKQKGGK